MIKTIKILLFLSCCCHIGNALDFDKKSSPSPPNVVFILADDLGWDDVGFHGSEIRTPNIDRLAREGVILNNYYVQPICTPTRAAILTGKYPIHTGMQHYVIVGSQPYGLPLTEKTLAQHLKARGYSTHAVGKWHLGFFKEDYLPTSRGFDSHLGYYLGKGDYFDHTTRDGNFFGYDFHHNGTTQWHESEVYSTEIFSSQADAIIKSHNKSKPLFLYMAHQAVHSGESTDPIQAPQKYIDRFPDIKNYKRRLFAGVVSALDDSVGQVYQSLKQAGLAHNTIIIFSTDNGGPTNGYDRNAACNWPLRGCKRTLWQGGVRGVGFVHSPLLKKSGYVNRNMMHVVDWLPTILDAVDATTTTTTTSTHTSNSNTSASSPNINLQARRKEMDQLDGVSQWYSISQNPSKFQTRKEVLLNIDPIEKIEGIVVGEFKLFKGQIKHGKFDGWYPPLNASYVAEEYEADSGPNLNLDIEGLFTNYMKSFYESESGNRISPLTKALTEAELDALIVEINKEYRKLGEKNDFQKSSLSDLQFQSEKSSDLNFNPSTKLTVRREVTNKAIAIQCGPKPANASTNCHPRHKYCLFHLTSDPCEYNNLAKSLPSVVAKLKARLDYYRSTMVPPGNKPIDPNGNPQLHGGVWEPWL